LPWAISDFGLAHHPGKAAITKPGRKLGPTYYLPHEMLPRPHVADGRSADVYSLAKTLWVLATDQNFPPQGEQRRDVEQLRISEWVNEPNASLLDQLMEDATRHEPQSRPSMREFAAELRRWLSRYVPDR
jgi:serine/threonine protein kinase